MRLKFAIHFTFSALACLSLQAQAGRKPDAPANTESTYIPVHRFDPARDAATDIEQAIAEAQTQGQAIYDKYA